MFVINMFCLIETAHPIGVGVRSQRQFKGSIHFQPNVFYSGSANTKKTNTCSGVSGSYIGTNK